MRSAIEASLSQTPSPKILHECECAREDDRFMEPPEQSSWQESQLIYYSKPANWVSKQEGHVPVLLSGSQFQREKRTVQFHQENAYANLTSPPIPSSVNYSKLTNELWIQGDKMSR